MNNFFCLETHLTGTQNSSNTCCFTIILSLYFLLIHFIIWTASSEFGTYRLCEQRRFRRACASAQSRQNLRCSLIQAVSQEEPSDRKPDPWPLWMAGHAQLKFVMTECSKTQIRLMGLILSMCIFTNVHKSICDAADTLSWHLIHTLLIRRTDKVGIWW